MKPSGSGTSARRSSTSASCAASSAFAPEYFDMLLAWSRSEEGGTCSGNFDSRGRHPFELDGEAGVHGKNIFSRPLSEAPNDDN